MQDVQEYSKSSLTYRTYSVCTFPYVEPELVKIKARESQVLYKTEVNLPNEHKQYFPKIESSQSNN